MIIDAKLTTRVIVEPVQVIEKLIEEATGYNGWITIIEGKYYKGTEVYYNKDEFTEVTKELYDYVEALKLVLKNKCIPPK